MTFRRITARTKMTVPCIMAYIGQDKRWRYTVVDWDLRYADAIRNTYTHWLPFQWQGRR